MGRKGSVIARRYVTVNSIEEKIMRLKEHKMSLSEHLLDLEQETVLSTTDLLELLR